LTDNATGRRYEGLHRLEDEPDVGDLYNFCPAPAATPSRGEPTTTTRVLADGPSTWELELRMPSVTTVVRLTQGIARAEFRTTIDNRDPDHRLRTVFPTGPTDATDVRAEGQFALVHRPLKPPAPRTEWVEPPDPTAHTLGAVALGPLGILTKGLPEYEARLTPAGPELCLTLLRCVGIISRPTGALSTRPLGAGPQTETPDGQCLGRHVCEYALLPGADALSDTQLLRAAHDYRHGFLVTPQPVQFDPPLSIDGDVVFSCLKGAEDGDGLILRCFNAEPTPARPHVPRDLRLDRVRLDETDETAVPDASRDRLELAPDEIATFRLIT
jgi:alpha-mannosidase/mannosylglycerate hydrolase